jgi:hypothetical protein
MLQACSQAVDLKVDRHFGEGQVRWKDGDRGGPARMQGIHRKNKEKTHLTHTGLLMEGVRTLALTRN